MLDQHRAPVHTLRIEQHPLGPQGQHGQQHQPFPKVRSLIGQRLACNRAQLRSRGSNSLRRQQRGRIDGKRGRSGYWRRSRGINPLPAPAHAGRLPRGQKAIRPPKVKQSASRSRAIQARRPKANSKRLRSDARAIPRPPRSRAETRTAGENSSRADRIPQPARDADSARAPRISGISGFPSPEASTVSAGRTFKVAAFRTLTSRVRTQRVAGCCRFQSVARIG